MSECAHCGKPLPARSGPGRPRSYCDGRCKAEAQAERDRLWKTIGRAVGAAVEVRGMTIEGRTRV